MGWTSSRQRYYVPQRTVDNKIRFVWLTDNHPGSVGDQRWLWTQQAIDYCNETRPSALVNTGDMTTYGQTPLIWSVFYQLRDCHRPYLAVIGNHDEEENTLGAGNPNTTVLESEAALGMSAPFNRTTTIESGDATVSARCFMLDTNIYNDNRSANHVVGDRVGLINGGLPGGYDREIGATQRSWIASVLDGDSTSDMVLIFMHYWTNTTCVDINNLVDILVDDGRPSAVFCGHNHADADKLDHTTTYDSVTRRFYKAPAMLESGCWVDVALSASGSSLIVDEMVLHNYTDPGGWLVKSPFTVAS